MKILPKHNIYQNRLLKKGLLLASNRGTLFSAGVSLTLSTFIRPLAILATPKTERENKQYACAKSLSSSLINFGVMLLASTPVANSIAEIDKHPEKYLKKSTIKILQNSEKSLLHSKKYSFATQLFKLGLGFLIATPKSYLTSNLIPPIMSKLFPNKNEQKNKQISFTANPAKLPKFIGKIIDTKCFQKLVNKYHNTNYEMNLMNLTDMTATGAFVATASKNRNIEDKYKRPLIYNAIISTGLSITGGHLINKSTQKTTAKFIEKFVEQNKNSKNLHKYVEGIHIAKSALILGGIYYLVIPVISTYVSEKIDKHLKHNWQS